MLTLTSSLIDEIMAVVKQEVPIDNSILDECNAQMRPFGNRKRLLRQTLRSLIEGIPLTEEQVVEYELLGGDRGFAGKSRASLEVRFEGEIRSLNQQIEPYETKWNRILARQPYIDYLTKTLYSLANSQLSAENIQNLIESIATLVMQAMAPATTQWDLGALTFFKKSILEPEVGNAARIAARVSEKLEELFTRP